MIDERSGCWEWQMNRSNQGYALEWHDGRNVLAHRVYYAKRYGECPPTLDHLCRNRACVNPEHLEPCSRGENVRRGRVAILNWDAVAEIRRLAETCGDSQRALARRLAPVYEVAEGTIRNVLMGQRWPVAEDPGRRGVKQ